MPFSQETNLTSSTAPGTSEWLSELILNGTSVQLGYTVPFTLVHAGKYRTEDKLEIQADNTQNKHNPEKPNNTKYNKAKLPGFSHLLQHSARKQGGLPAAHTGLYVSVSVGLCMSLWVSVLCWTPLYNTDPDGDWVNTVRTWKLFLMNLSWWRR